MTIWHVGGLAILHRVNSLKDAAAKAKHDDVIEIHKNLTESVQLNHDVIIKGNQHALTVPDDSVGLLCNNHITIKDLTIQCTGRSNAIKAEENLEATNLTILVQSGARKLYPKVICNGHFASFTNSSLQSITTSEITHLTLQQSQITSYFGERNNANADNEFSYIAGSLDASDSSLSHLILQGQSKLEQCQLKGYISDYGTSTYANCTLSLPNLPNKKEEKQFKKSPLYQDLAPIFYSCWLKGREHHFIQLQVNDSWDNIHPEQTTNILGLYIEKQKPSDEQPHVPETTVEIKDTHLEKNQVTHLGISGSLRFSNTIDQNHWELQPNIAYSLINSHINSNRKYETALEKLDQMIGLTSVKERLHTILNTVQINQQHYNGNENTQFSYHMIFAGQPGTGKTTVGKIVAQALYEAGAIPSNKYTYYKPSEWLSKWVNASNSLTREALEKGKGGVIFLDEAYVLSLTENDSVSNTSKEEVLAELLAFMEENRGNTVFIAAGYPKEMSAFVASNTGLFRRFTWIQFEDYNAEEMSQILHIMLKDYNVTISKQLYPSLIVPLFEQLIQLNLSIPDQFGNVTNGGNGGLVRNVLQGMLEHRNNRLIQEQLNPLESTELTLEDIKAGFKAEFDKTTNIRLKPTN